MTVPQSNESFLLAQFRDFYTEVIRLKQMIKESGGMTTAEAAPAEATANGNGNGNGNGAGNGSHGNVTQQLPVLDPKLLETLSGSEKITSLAVRGTLDSPAEPSAEQTRLTLLVWQNLIALFRRN